jgi:hypothetical protein
LRDLGLPPLTSLARPTWLATRKTTRLATWETSLCWSWKAPLVVGLAEGQRATRSATENLLAKGCRGQRLGGGWEHAGEGRAWGSRKP